MSGPSAALPLTIGVATVGSASSDQGSASAERLVELLSADGHTVLSRIALDSDREHLDSQLAAWGNHPAIDTIMVLGGIGVGPFDVTTEAVSQVVLRETVGFGETVRRLAAESPPSGMSALGALSLRAMAGVGKNTIVFALPDNVRLIELLYPRLIGPLCDTREAGSLAALVPTLRSVG